MASGVAHRRSRAKGWAPDASDASIFRLSANALPLVLMVMLGGCGLPRSTAAWLPKSAGQSAPQTSSDRATTPETKFDVPDATRRAILFTKYALDVRLETRDATMHARAIVTVKNESATALDAIPLQISSSLAWEAINAEGKALHFAHHTVATDADHTGAMDEALVTLPEPLAAGGEQTLTVFYSGSAAPSAKRLEAIGTPPDVALHADWDGIREEFTGLRGFGNVLWYPVCDVPVALGDGDRFFSAIGMTKLRESRGNCFYHGDRRVYRRRADGGFSGRRSGAGRGDAAACRRTAACRASLRRGCRRRSWALRRRRSFWRVGRSKAATT